MIDGEGHLVLARVGRWKGKPYIQPHISVTNSDEDALLKVRDLMGGQIFVAHTNGKRPVWTAVLKAAPHVKAVLEAVLPDLAIKGPRARMLLEWIAIRHYNHSPYGERELELYRRFHAGSTKHPGRIPWIDG